MKNWQRIEQRMATDGVDTITSKIEIDDGFQQHNLYVKIGWITGKPVMIDITIARHSKRYSSPGVNSESPAMMELRQMMIENARSALEIICREASLLLSSRRCTLSEIANLWIVTRMDPQGRCRQVGNAETDYKVHGPLDAVAKLFMLKAEEWERKMGHEYDDEDIERMISECAVAIEERPKDFTGWEMDFIESVSDANETTHLSDSQVEKLEQIWEDRNCG